MFPRRHGRRPRRSFVGHARLAHRSRSVFGQAPPGKIIPLAGPLNTEVIADNANLDTVAANLRGIGQKVWTVDHNTNFPVSTLEDGIHPNWTGYQHMAVRWRCALDVVGCW